MEETVGKTKIQMGKVKKIDNDEIDQLKTKMKDAKRKFGEACKEQKTSKDKLQALNEYYTTQHDQQLRNKKK